MAGYIPRTVTHLSTNRAQRRVTSLMRPTPLPLRQTATPRRAAAVVAESNHLIVVSCVADDWDAEPDGIAIYTYTVTVTSVVGLTSVTVMAVETC